MNKYFLLPYQMTSQSSKSLAQELGITRIYPDRHYKGRPHHILINWGYNTTPQVPVSKCKTILNPFTSIPYVSDKLKFFNYQTQARKVRHTTNFYKAREYANYGAPVFCRKILNGHGGIGIVLARTPDDVVEAPLYTIGCSEKVKEYRVHVFQGNAFHVQQKRKMSDEKLKELNITHKPLIRNYKNGYVFTINEIDPPSEDTITQAKQIIGEYALDFGAVDILETKDGKGHILEINSAPGLEGTTLAKYAEVFRHYLESL